MLLRRRLEAPVRSALCGDEIADTGGHAHEQAVILSARFQHRDFDVRIFGQPVRQRTSSTAAADDHIVKAGAALDFGHDVTPFAAYRAAFVFAYQASGVPVETDAPSPWRFHSTLLAMLKQSFTVNGHLMAL